MQTRRHKAQQDCADVLFLAGLAEHGEGDADEGQHGGEGVGLQQLQDEAAALQTAQGEDPGGDGGADVGTHDDTHGLLQSHNAGVNKADDHDGGCGGGLDHAGDGEAGEKTGEFVGGQLGEDHFQLAAGGALQGIAHHVHAEQEQAQAAQKGQYVKQIHKNIPFLS